MNEITFDDIYKNVITKLEQDLSKELTYHNSHHTKYVVERVKQIAAYENIAGRDLYLLKIAALYHDSGFLTDREGHENLGCQLASRELEELLTPDEVKKVCGMIMATKIPQSPENILEKIVADADLFYLGTTNYKQFSKKLFVELKNFDTSMNEEQWLKIQIDFLSSHSYHTSFGQEKLEPVKQKTLTSLKAC